MKRIKLSLTVAAILLAIGVFMRCESSVQKEDDAQAKVLEAEQELEAAQNTAKAQQAVSVEEWEIFKRESELKIKKNELRIAEIKIKMNKPGKTLDAIYAKRIETLEQKNKALKVIMETYVNSPSDWESFKSEFSHDINELGEALKDITVDNKN
jgi:regulator of protease activity HflC (stomatin/prohibitin superfamily)